MATTVCDFSTVNSAKMSFLSPQATEMYFKGFSIWLMHLGIFVSKFRFILSENDFHLPPLTDETLQKMVPLGCSTKIVGVEITFKSYISDTICSSLERMRQTLAQLHI